MKKKTKIVLNVVSDVLCFAGFAGIGYFFAMLKTQSKLNGLREKYSDLNKKYTDAWMEYPDEGNGFSQLVSDELKAKHDEYKYKMEMLDEVQNTL